MAAQRRHDMKVSKNTALLLVCILAFGACSSRDASSSKPGGAQKNSAVTVPFKEARLIVETNATDGDAGLQLFLDHEPWRSVALFTPEGTKILEVRTESLLKDYGLTELFSESSEPPFTRFPLAEFKKLFPKGNYRLVGTTIEGAEIESTITLTHDFPAGPKILTPRADSKVSANDLIVSWESVTEPKGIDIIGYQVLVVREEPLRVFSADLPASAKKIRIPIEFVESGVEYKVEVLAIESNRNQTLSEITFKVS